MLGVILSAAKNLNPVRGFEILHPDKSGFRMILIPLVLSYPLIGDRKF